MAAVTLPPTHHASLDLDFSGHLRCPSELHTGEVTLPASTPSAWGPRDPALLWQLPPRLSQPLCFCFCPLGCDVLLPAAPCSIWQHHLTVRTQSSTTSFISHSWPPRTSQEQEPPLPQSPLGYPVHIYFTWSHAFPISPRLLENLPVSSQIDTRPGPKEGPYTHRISKNANLDGQSTSPLASGFYVWFHLRFPSGTKLPPLIRWGSWGRERDWGLGSGLLGRGLREFLPAPALSSMLPWG